MKTNVTLEDRIRDIESALAELNPQPHQKLRWEVERDRRFELEQTVDNLIDEVVRLKEVLEHITELSPGCTSSADLAISFAMKALKETK